MERPSLGILGGTFDPPHNGHLAIAQAALSRLNLLQVLFAPARQPPHKPNQPISPVEERVEMVRLAIAPYPRFAISRVDVDRAGPTFTADTLRLLRLEWGEHIPLYFIIGMDSLVNLPSWYKPEELIRLCLLAVFNRPGFKPDWNSLEERLPGLRQRIVMIPAPALEISASDIQRRIRLGQPIRGLVPDTVAAYMHSHGTYQAKKRGNAL